MPAGANTHQSASYHPTMTETPQHVNRRPALELMLESLSDERQKSRFTRLLALLDVPATAERTRRIEATVGVVAAARHTDARSDIGARLGADSPLSLEDARAVDRWVEGGRDERLDALVTLLDLPADDARESRIDATLSHMQDAIDHETTLLKLDPVADISQGRRRFQLRDLGAIAAAIVLIAAISFPAISNFQANTWSTQSAANLQQAGFASSLFAQDNDAKVPYAIQRELEPNNTNAWWLVGDPQQSHSANLFALISNNYVPLETLNAPSNPDAPHNLKETVGTDWASASQMSYSYRLFDPMNPPRITDLRGSILLSDRSPVVRQARASKTIDATINSDIHNGKGQHVVFGDSSVVFLTSPILPSGDNIWLPKRAEKSGTLSLRGDERPDSPHDQFVGP